MAFRARTPKCVCRCDVCRDKAEDGALVSYTTRTNHSKAQLARDAAAAQQRAGAKRPRGDDESAAAAAGAAAAHAEVMAPMLDRCDDSLIEELGGDGFDGDPENVPAEEGQLHTAGSMILHDLRVVS